MNINEQIKLLPKWIHILHEPFSCPHCKKPYYLDEKLERKTAYLKVIWSGEWIVRYDADGGRDMKQLMSSDLETAINAMKAWIEENKEELRPYYEEDK